MYIDTHICIFYIYIGIKSLRTSTNIFNSSVLEWFGCLPVFPEPTVFYNCLLHVAGLHKNHCLKK